MSSNSLQLRACLVCSLLKTRKDFESGGCDNCEEFLKLKGNKPRIMDCTSANFVGTIVMISEECSYVAKIQQIDKKVPGDYAISVSGQLLETYIKEMENQGIIYRSRDKSQQEL